MDFCVEVYIHTCRTDQKITCFTKTAALEESNFLKHFIDHCWQSTTHAQAMQVFFLVYAWYPFGHVGLSDSDCFLPPWAPIWAVGQLILVSSAHDITSTQYSLLFHSVSSRFCHLACMVFAAVMGFHPYLLMVSLVKVCSIMKFWLILYKAKSIPHPGSKSIQCTSPRINSSRTQVQNIILFFSFTWQSSHSLDVLRCPLHICSVSVQLVL
jgi:hypothetical protein